MCISPKVCTRDYYDLYFLLKEGMSLREMFEYSQNILEGINFKLFAVALLYIDDIEDDNIEYLEPKESISKEKIRDYFQSKLDRVVRESWTCKPSQRCS